MRQYFIKVVRTEKELVYFNFGMDKHRKYKDTATCLSDEEYITVTTYQVNEFEEYKEHVNDLLQDSKGKLSIHI